MQKRTSFKLISTLFLLIIFIVSLTLSHTVNGAYVSMDSLFYFAKAYNFANNKGLMVADFEQLQLSYEPVTMWPPLYAAILGLSCKLINCGTIQMTSLALIINILMLIISISLLFQIFRQIVGLFWSALGCSLFFLIPGVQVVYTYAWSETIFIPLLLLAFIYQHRFTQNYQISDLLKAAFILALATYTRYVGVAFALGFMLSLTWLHKELLWSQRIKTITRYWLIAGVGYALLIMPLLIYNWSQSGHLSGGERGIPEFRLTHDPLLLVSIVFREWFVSNIYLFFTGSILILALTAIRLLKYRFPLLVKNKIANPTIGRIALTWLLSYIAFLLISRNIQHVDFDSRMLSIAWPLLLITLATYFKQTLSLNNKEINREKPISHQSRHNLPIFLNRLLLILLVGCLFYNGIKTHQQILVNKKQERGVGSIANIHYPNILNPAFDTYRALAKNVENKNIQLVISDVNRLILIQYFFEKSHVWSFQKMLTQLLPTTFQPQLNTSASIEEPLNPIKNIKLSKNVSPEKPTVLFLLTSEQSLQQFINKFGQTLNWQRFKITNTQPGVLIATIPLEQLQKEPL